MNALIDAVRDAVLHHGVWMVFALMILESACIPVPSEVIMLVGGYMVYTHDASLLGVTVAGVAGNVIGSWIAWGIGAYGGRELLERHGKWLHVSERNLDWADRWFAKYGAVTVLVTRCLPIIRTFISLPAGIARMPLWRFTLYTLVGCIPWVLMLAYVGKRLGPHWTRAHDYLHYVDYLIVLAVLLALAYFLFLRPRRLRRA